MSPRPSVEHLRRPQIVEAAAEVLYERGLFDTRIGDVAQRAGTSSSTILYYFESKDRLLEQAVDRSDREFYARVLDGQVAHSGASARLVHLIEETSLGPGGLHDWTLWMEMWVRARRDPVVRENYFRLDRRLRGLIAEIVRDGQASGEFDDGADPDEFATSLSGLLDGLGVQVTLGQPDVTPERMVDSCLSLASALLGRELRAERTARPITEGETDDDRPDNPTNPSIVEEVSDASTRRLV
jgi:AcrR family transcriptional regulator